jgi:hypothetical protein
MPSTRRATTPRGAVDDRQPFDRAQRGRLGLVGELEVEAAQRVARGRQRLGATGSTMPLS